MAIKIGMTNTLLDFKKGIKMKIQPSKNTTKDNKYRMHKGSLKLLIDDLEQFMDDWYMVCLLYTSDAADE